MYINLRLSFLLTSLKVSNIEKVLTSLEEFQLNAENKYSIIMSTENEIKETIQNLEIIQTHEKYINSENFQSKT